MAIPECYRYPYSRSVNDCFVDEDCDSSGVLVVVGGGAFDCSWKEADGSDDSVAAPMAPV